MMNSFVTYLKYNNKDKLGSNDVPVLCCILVPVLRPRWVSVVCIPEEGNTSRVGSLAQ